MYILIDRERMAFIYKHDSMDVLQNLAWLELSYTATQVFPCNYPLDLDHFTDLELKLLYRQTTGNDHIGFSRDLLLANVFALVAELNTVQVKPMELSAQAAAVAREDEKQYRYKPGSTKPQPVADLFEVPIQRVTSVQPLKTLTAPLASERTESPWPFTATAAQNAANPAAQRVRAPRAPADPNAVPGRPKPGSTTGQVWDIADECKGQATGKELRKLVIQKCTEAGINSSTASVQFGKWIAANSSA